MLANIDRSKLEGLPPELRARVEAEIAAAEALTSSNPLQALRRNPAQVPFFSSSTRTTAAIAGNQFGKTTALVVRSLIECLPEELLPKWLRPFKRYHEPVQGRLVCPSYDLVEQNLVPTFREWTPKGAMPKGFDKGWNQQSKVLTFGVNGSFIDFKTYETELDKFGGVRRHFVGYDEPPPRPLRDEGLRALMRYGGFEMMAFTPVKANTGWLRREILKKRESPDITVVRGSIHDNVALDPDAKRYFLESLPNDLWRRAREYGDFVEVGGLIYPEFDRCVLKHEHALLRKRGDEYLLDPEFVRSLDHVVGIDPGIRNAGFSFNGFDGENAKWAFQDGKLQDATPRQYAEFIRGVLGRWGIPLDRVAFVVDPAARQRGQTNAETVMSALAQEGIYCSPGQNDVEAGIGQVRTRMQHDRYWVAPNCRYLRDEADDYAAEEPAEGKDDSHMVPIKGNDHVLDADRYVCMHRFWDPVMEAGAVDRNLGWEPGKAPPLSQLTGPREAVPMGDMS